MKTLAELSRTSYAHQRPVHEGDLTPLRQQYHDLLSCYQGLTVQVDAARFMSDKMIELFSFVAESLTEILHHTQTFAVRPNDSRSCMLLLEYEIVQLLHNMTAKFNDFYVPRLHWVLKDFENQSFCYTGFRFVPPLTESLESTDFISKALKSSPLASVSMFNLITEKTSRVVDCCNDAWLNRQLHAESYISDVEHYFALRSELRGLSRSISPAVKSALYKETVCAKMQVILRGLHASSDSWMHESVNNLFM